MTRNTLLQNIICSVLFWNILCDKEYSPTECDFDEYFSGILCVTNFFSSSVLFVTRNILFQNISCWILLWNILCDKDYYSPEYYLLKSLELREEKSSTRSSHSNYYGCVCGRVAGCDKCDKSGQRSAVSWQHVTNVTNAVTAGRATGPLMGHMNTQRGSMMAGMVMTACNTAFVTEDIGAHAPTISLFFLIILAFSHESQIL